MNGVRIAITTFTLILLMVVGLGWKWTATHQPPALRTASQIVLALSAAAGLFAVVKIWTTRTR
jgi:hypothetical protein